MSAIDVDGNLAVLGVASESSFLTNGGVVRVYEDTGTQWAFVQDLRPAALTDGDRFGGAVAIDGDWILASTATGEPDIISFFHRTAAGWTEVQSVSVLNNGSSAVAVDGEWAAVGGVDSSGRSIVEIYRLQGTSWSLFQTVSPHVNDNSPETLEFAQGTLWVGGFGVAFLFEFIQGQWEQVTRFHGSESNPGIFTGFGLAMDTDGMTVVVGAQIDQTLAGAAYVFEQVGGQWVETARLSRPESTSGFIGQSVSVNGDLIAVGANDRLELWRRSSTGWEFDETLHSATSVRDYAADVALTSDNSRALVATSQPRAYVIDLSFGGNPVSYCSSTINSSFERGRILFNGITSIGANSARLGTMWAGSDSTGLFYYGDEAIQVPFGDGFRCVGGRVTRIMPPVVTNMGGGVFRTLDLTAPPFNSGRGHITPGSTWRFQFWFRDPMGMMTSAFNTTDAVEVTFCP